MYILSPVTKGYVTNPKTAVYNESSIRNNKQSLNPSS